MEHILIIGIKVIAVLTVLSTVGAVIYMVTPRKGRNEYPWGINGNWYYGGKPLKDHQKIKE